MLCSSLAGISLRSPHFALANGTDGRDNSGNLSQKALERKEPKITIVVKGPQTEAENILEPSQEVLTVMEVMGLRELEPCGR